MQIDTDSNMTLHPPPPPPPKNIYENPLPMWGSTKLLHNCQHVRYSCQSICYRMYFIRLKKASDGSPSLTSSLVHLKLGYCTCKSMSTVFLKSTVWEATGCLKYSELLLIEPSPEILVRWYKTFPILVFICKVV